MTWRRTKNRVTKVIVARRIKATLGGQTCAFKSLLEFKWACWLEFLKLRGHIRGWKYEPFRFPFLNEKTAPVGYTPDFLVIEKDGSETYHETKGYHDGETNTKLRRMNKHFPSVKIELWLSGLSKKTASRRTTAAKFCSRIGDCNTIFGRFADITRVIAVEYAKNEPRLIEAANHGDGMANVPISTKIEPA